MDKKSKVKVKRAGQPVDVSERDKDATPETKWTAMNHGGNVLDWLAEKTGKPAQESRGAIDYLTSVDKRHKYPKASQGETASTEKTASHIPVPRSKVPAAQVSPLVLPPNPVSRIAEVLSSGSAPAQRAEGGTNTLPNEPTKHDGPPPRHAVTGRRRGNMQERLGRMRAKQYEKLLKQQEEARERHEEAMRTDPEYQRRYQSYQEMQQSMHASQVHFFQQYNAQQHLLHNHVVVERLDIPVILDLIDQHDVVFICTDTGTGKSTTVPKALLELSPKTRVVSTQPRRTATVAVANRVASLRREVVGEDVGYWIRGEKRGDEQTRLWYMTSYTLLLRLLEYQDDIPYTHIVLDEFHERQPDIEVTVALLRMALLTHTGKFKLVLMSATLNTSEWEDYFSGLKVATYKQSEPEHPIHDYFLEDTCTLLGLDFQAPEALMLRPTVDKETLDNHIYIAQSLLMFINSFSSPEHSILVFLPGRAQVESMQMWLSSQLKDRMDVIPWHSAVDLSVIEAAMKRRVHNRQKIYLATDIAEVSITLPDVVFVVDLVLVKRPKITKEAAPSILYPPLVTQWICKGSVAQRRGRIGRVQQGFYFCLFPAAQIDTLRQYAQPPIENSRIDELSLHCLQVASNPIAIFSVCRGQPLKESIVSSMNALTELGCILPKADPLAAGEAFASARNNANVWGPLVLEGAKAAVKGDIDEFEYTFLGRMLQLIPVGSQAGVLVFFGFLTGLESLMILASAVTSSLSPFTLNTYSRGGGGGRVSVVRAMEETENVMRDMCCGLRSDIVAVMKATLQFRIEAGNGGEHSQTVKQWCDQKHLSHDKLLSIIDLERHIKFELADFVPFHDVEDPRVILEQLDKLAAMVAVMTNVAFASQSVEVTSESNTFTRSQEMAIGIFSHLSAVPDIHSPSCLRWQEGDIIIPVQLNLNYDKLLASFSTAIASPKQFWMSLLLFSYRLHYATFSDDEGTFHVFSVTYCGNEHFVEVDNIAGYTVVEFRRALCGICQILRLSQVHKNMFEDDFNNLLQSYRLKSLQEAQRDVITALVAIFERLEGMTVNEVDHEEDDLDSVSILAFALPSGVQ